MHKCSIVACFVTAAALSGCVGATKKDLSREIAQHCASYGDDVRVRVKEPELAGGIFGSVVASGECLRPGDAGHEDAMTIEEYLASLHR